MASVVPSDTARALFYSHDTVGLGHLRRTLLICKVLGERFGDRLSALILTGSAAAHQFPIQSTADYIKLPSVRKIENELYVPRSLPIQFNDLLALREQVIRQTVQTYRPDFLFVDNVPLGLQGELLATLKSIRRNLPQTRVFLNLRDIIDSPQYVASFWKENQVFEAIERYYDRVFIYGQREVFDALTAYEAPPVVRRKTLYCGYLPRTATSASLPGQLSEIIASPHKLAVITVGGGSDGAAVIETYLRALTLLPASEKPTSVVLAGPEADPEVLGRLRSQHAGPDVHFVDFCEEPLPLLSRADIVVSMGGYNTLSEILYLEKPAVVVPRSWPRQEQVIRARRLQELGHVRMIHPNSLSPDTLAKALSEGLANVRSGSRTPVDFGGADRLAAAIESELGRRNLALGTAERALAS